MPYILNKTNGSIVATVQDASLDLTTDLVFVGRNYAGYGEWQNENFLKLLENFANTISPPKKIEGQLWYNINDKTINAYDGENWKSLANLVSTTTDPSQSSNTNYQPGDLWYDSREQQLYVFNGESFVLIGPPSGADTKASWRGDIEYAEEDTQATFRYSIKSILGANNEVIAIVSADEYTVAEATQAPFPRYPLYNSEVTTKIAKGITLYGSDPITGNSEAAGTYFWGTARHAANANTATFALSIGLEEAPEFGRYPIPFVNTSTSALQAESVYTDPNNFYYDPNIKTVKADFFDGIATSAYYADLAERYEADALYDEGTVVVIGGPKEITISTEHASTAVAGVVSKKPAYLMNSKAGNDETHPAIALKGRIPCKIYGPVRKGELLVTSANRPGYATARQLGDDPNAVIGKALEDFKGLSGVIEIKV